VRAWETEAPAEESFKYLGGSLVLPEPLNHTFNVESALAANEALAVQFTFGHIEIMFDHDASEFS
jgi:hypothetical protein